MLRPTKIRRKVILSPLHVLGLRLPLLLERYSDQCLDQTLHMAHLFISLLDLSLVLLCLHLHLLTVHLL